MGTPAAAAPPEALAGRAFLAYPGDTIELNGSQSSDPDGDPIATWAWSQVDGPVVALAKTGGSSPTFTVQEPGTYSFELVVGAGGQTSAPDVVDVIVVDPDAGARHSAGASGCSAAPGAPLSGLAVAGLLALVGGRRRRA
jgi:MYXO-CTERM domain-containing protein